jgi:hypothetical protein
MLNRVRLPFYLSKPQYPAEEDIYLKGNGRRVVLKSIVSKVMDGKTEYMPYKLHERLTIALRHDEVNVESEMFTGSIRISGAYDINWIDFLDYPVAQAVFKAFEEEFVARSNKCDICDPSANITLEDDAFDDTLDEGTEYEINVAENDNICCDSPVFSIESFDTDIIDTIDIDQMGVVTLTLKTPIDSYPDHLLFTYKVTCGDGTEETADVYGTVEGSNTPLCEAPTDLVLSLIEPSSNPAEIHAEWVEPGGGAPTDGYEWQLLDETGAIVISFGTTTDLFVNVNSLDCDKTYKFKVRSICDLATADVSAFITGDIDVPGCEGVAIDNARYSDNLLTHCSEPPNIIYTSDGTVAPGKIIYTDPALSVPLIGYTFISASGATEIFNIDPSTGEVISTTGSTC